MEKSSYSSSVHLSPWAQGSGSVKKIFINCIQDPSCAVNCDLIIGYWLIGRGEYWKTFENIEKWSGTIQYGEIMKIMNY